MSKLLWANMQCLVDPTSGASLSIRNALKGLHGIGWDIRILGATCFDNPSAITAFPENEKEKIYDTENFKGLKIKDGPLTHDLINTDNSNRDRILVRFENTFFKTYTKILEEFKPDVVWLYGGRPLDCLVASDASLKGAVVASYLVNGGYHSRRWARDYDTIITDSNATKNLYKERLNLNLTKIGKFLDHSQISKTIPTTSDILVINPAIEKGGLLIVQVAYHLVTLGRNIKIRVAESRGDLSAVVDAVAKHYNVPSSFFDDIFVNLGTIKDMQSFYESGRILFAPSVWYESGSRALAESTLSGRPVITTDCGGNKEMIGNSGTVIRLPDFFHEKPYNKLLPEKNVAQLTDAILKYFDDEEYYREKSKAARTYGAKVHDSMVSAKALSDHFKKLILEKNKKI